MKNGWELGASTLGAPGASLEQVIETLSSAGVTWVELRAAADAVVSIDLSAAERLVIRERLESTGLKVLAVASGVRICRPGADDEVVGELIDHVRLAADLGARFVRVFPGMPVLDAPFDEVPQPIGDRTEAEEAAARRLGKAAAYASDLGVCVALECHDSHPRGADVRGILDRVADVSQPTVGVIWDVLHPWRVGEPPALTWQALAPFLSRGWGYVQVKDVASRRDLTPVLPGNGIVPLVEALSVLRSGRYRGPISLEWERTWYPQIPSLAGALPAARTVLNST